MWRNFDTPYLDDADRPRPTSQLDLALAAAEPPTSQRPRREARLDERPTTRPQARTQAKSSGRHPRGPAWGAAVNGAPDRCIKSSPARI
jgi:hypothetical protein